MCSKSFTRHCSSNRREYMLNNEMKINSFFSRLGVRSSVEKSGDFQHKSVGLVFNMALKCAQSVQNYDITFSVVVGIGATVYIVLGTFL